MAFDYDILVIGGSRGYKALLAEMNDLASGTSSAYTMSLRDPHTKGFEYSDGWVQDAHMVVLNARDAAPNS